jgi:DNA-directed RNA polymerase specialized sigma24 family protein
MVWFRCGEVAVSRKREKQGKGVCLVTENVIVRNLRGIAAKLTTNAELQKDLMQEMFLHLTHVEAVEAGQTLSWYLKGCEFHARNYLKRGRSIDSPKRAHHAVALDETPSDEDRRDGNGPQPQPLGPIEIQGEMLSTDLVNQIMPRLTDMQRRVLLLLLKGYGVREAGREIGITHPAVIKHRKKIARIAHELLAESGKTVESGNGMQQS